MSCERVGSEKRGWSGLESWTEQLERLVSLEPAEHSLGNSAAKEHSLQSYFDRHYYYDLVLFLFFDFRALFPALSFAGGYIGQSGSSDFRVGGDWKFQLRSYRTPQNLDHRETECLYQIGGHKELSSWRYGVYDELGHHLFSVNIRNEKTYLRHGRY